MSNQEKPIFPDANGAEPTVAPDEYSSYILSPGYADGYIENFREYAEPDFDLNDPEVKARLATPLADVLEQSEATKGFSRTARSLELTVRDAFALGALEFVLQFPRLSDEQDDDIVTALQQHMPGIPLLNGLAPPAVARWLYDDPLEIPLTVQRGRKMTVGNVLGTDDEIHYRKRIAALTGDEPVVDILAQPGSVLPDAGNGGSTDALTSAIEDVTHTLGNDN